MYIHTFSSSQKPSGRFFLRFPSSTSSNICSWFPSLVPCLLFPSSKEMFFVLWFPSLFLFCMVSVVAGKHLLFMVSIAGLLVDSAAAGGSIIVECIERFLVCCAFRTGLRRWFFCGFRRGRKSCLLFVWFPSLVPFLVVARNVFCMVSVVGFLMVSGRYRTAAVSPMETIK